MMLHDFKILYRMRSKFKFQKIGGKVVHTLLDKDSFV